MNAVGQQQQETQKSLWLVLDRRTTPGVEKIGLEFARAALNQGELFSYGYSGNCPNYNERSLNFLVPENTVDFSALHRVPSVTNQLAIPRHQCPATQKPNQLHVNIHRVLSPDKHHRDVDLKADDYMVQWVETETGDYNRLFVQPLTRTEIHSVVANPNYNADLVLQWLDGQIGDRALYPVKKMGA